MPRINQPKIIRLIAFLTGLVLTIIIVPKIASFSSSSIEPDDAVTLTDNRPDSDNEFILGTNLNGIAPWSTQLPFLNHFKSSKQWITQCIKEDPGCKGEWDTKEDELLDLDENGWVKSLPSPKNSAEYTRVSTSLFRDIPGVYPSGQYIVLYDGEGEIKYRQAAKKDESASTPGRDVINVDSSVKSGVLLTITKTDPQNTGNYIRNIRFVQAEYENRYQNGEIFNPAFIEKTKPYKALRFMDWMETNHSGQSEWQDRPKVEKASYSHDGGVPIEIMVELANNLQADPWFNMPHKATDEYMRNFAQLVKETLDPNLTAYVEYSNEVWNTNFKQFHWVRDNGAIAGQKTAFQSYGVRTAQMCDIWKDVFSGSSERIQCVISTHTANRWAAKQVLECDKWSEAPCYQHGVDALGITSYFSGRLGKPEYEKIIESWINDPKIDEFERGISHLKDGDVLDTDDSVEDFQELFQHYSEVAKAKQLKLVAYEGGNHVVGLKKVKDNDKLTEYFIELNRRPEFYELYQTMLNSWQDPEGVRTAFMHFSDINKPSKWGSWGALESVSQEHSPKYDALMDFAK
ncbi:MAG: cellulose-binding protein [Microcoleaceae cyanobacterium]